MRMTRAQIPLSIFLIGIFLLPFVFWPTANPPFEVPRVWFFLIWTEVLLVSSIPLFLLRPSQTLQRVHVPGLVITVLLAGSFVISSVLGVNLEHSVVGNYYRLDGLITLSHLIACSLWFCVFFQKSWLNAVFSVIATTVLLLDVITIWQGFTQGGAVGGVTFGQPNFLAGYLLVGAPTLISFSELFPKQFHILVKIIGFLLTLVAIVFTQSFGALLGVGLFVVGIWCLQSRSRTNILFSATVVFLLLFSFAAYIAFKDTFNPESRERIVRKLVPAIAARPVFGWGVANVDAAFRSTVWPSQYLLDIRVDKAHSSILESFVTLGVVGGGVYCVLLWYMARRLSAQEGILLLMFVLYVYHAQTNVISMSEEIFFWILLGISLQNKLP